jgi:hypothetical protein
MLSSQTIVHDSYKQEELQCATITTVRSAKLRALMLLLLLLLLTHSYDECCHCLDIVRTVTGIS